jgi:hypothetical protein
VQLASTIFGTINSGELGHNYKSCKQPLNPNRKRWKPKTRKPKKHGSQAAKHMYKLLYMLLLRLKEKNDIHIQLTNN